VGALGGILGGIGSKENKLDWNQINQMFGPGALAGGAEQLYGAMLQSPLLQQILTSGAQQGNMLQQRMMQNMGRSGLQGSPMGQFARAAGQGYGGNIQRNMLSQLYMQALQQAATNLQGRMGMFGQQQQIPSFMQQLGGAFMGAGAQGLLNQK
jgi:hypothetical protein